ncbi:hypothetical protein AB0M05_19475 [Streptomyces violaceusniger]|uniref:hypothetical protein n=1 Tax=Streptomyces violaceusniger TaxID=68280 RepID=UPI00343C110E
MARDPEVVRLAVIPGDGIRPEVVAATVPTLRTAPEAEAHRPDVTSYDWGGERYLRQGAAMPADAADLVKKADAGAARRARDAVAATLRDARHHTADLGGSPTTAQVASAVPHTMESQG